MKQTDSKLAERKLKLAPIQTSTWPPNRAVRLAVKLEFEHAPRSVLTLATRIARTKPASPSLFSNEKQASLVNDYITLKDCNQTNSGKDSTRNIKTKHASVWEKVELKAPLKAELKPANKHKQVNQAV